jgi:protein-glutamine gamma-glutamyltransferase
MLMPKKLLLQWSVIQMSLLVLLQQAFAWWIISIFAGLIVYRLALTLAAKAAISLTMVNLLAGTITLLLLFNIKQAGVLHFMLQILLLAAVSRLLALQHLHEARQLIWVHYFLLGCCFILHQDMTVALLILLILALNIFSHFSLFAPVRARLSWRQSGQGLLIILPLWLGMFLLFPRLPPFWQIPNAKVASTGLSDTLDPGSIEQLVQDDSLAFRVEFSGPLPPRQQLYWRSLLYEDFNGRSWQVNPLRQQLSRATAGASVSAETTAVQHYRIIAEASHQTNLFALAQPTASQGQVFIAPSGLISAAKPVSQRLSYQVSSLPGPINVLAQQEQQLNMQLPEGNPQTLQFARQLSQQFPQPPELVQAIATYFRQQAFYYSLTPPRLGNNSVDEFLFRSRIGFCSHYASATALMLRAAGVPARVIGGYQGGDWYPAQGYLAVRQREAHAWVEYLHNGQWQPFDPTAAVAPERILNGLDSALSAEQRQLLNLGWSQIGLFQTLRQQLMHLDYYWSVWVLGFDDANQRDIWRNLHQHIAIIATTLALLMLLIMGIALVYYYLHRPVPSLPMATRLMQRACAKLLEDKAPQQTLSAFLRQYYSVSNDNNDWLLALIRCYERALYCDDVMALTQLKQLLKRHRVQLNALRLTVKNT